MIFYREPREQSRTIDINDLRIGDIFYLSGTLVTGRDEVYHRVIEENISPPIDLKNAAIYHAGPIVKEITSPTPHSSLLTPHSTPDTPHYELVSLGPTTSARMEKWAADFIIKTGVKVMIGKGSMGEKTAAACREYGAIHCVYPGGCAVLGASQIENIENCFWPEFGMAECMWVMKSRIFGPLIVSIDTKGNNLFKENSCIFNNQKEKILLRDIS